MTDIRHPLLSGDLKNVTIITPTRRLSRLLRYRHAQQQIDAGQQAWKTLDCLPWNAWCKRSYEQIALLTNSRSLVLGDKQQLWVWQQIIGQSHYRQQLLQVTATAKQAMQAYQLCRQWCIPIFPETVYLSAEAQAFRSWANSYEQYKREHSCIDESELPDYLHEYIAALNDTESKIVFFGFDSFDKQQQRLINSLQQQSDVQLPDVSMRNKDTAVYTANDKQSEFRAAACWARAKLEAHPEATIGIVSPRLKQVREQLLNSLNSVLTPSLLLKPLQQTNEIWSIAQGIPLIEYPMIDCAMELLALGKRKIDVNILGKLLHSEFLNGAQTEYARRALFDDALRQFGEQQLSLKSLYRFSERHCQNDNDSLQFIQLVKDFEITFLSHPRTQTLRQWAILFSELLSGFGWPGERSPNSVEHQTLSAWHDCLSELGKLDTTNTRLDYAVALSQLNRLLNESYFQPETAETPIQVTGLEACAAMQFDYLWILDMQDDVWPEPAVTNAFIPAECLREAGVPTANAENRLQQAILMTQQLRQSAIECVFSYSTQDGDRECRPSPLIQEWSDRTIADSQDYQGPQQLIFEAAQLDHFTDIDGPEITDNKLVSGGSVLFKDQSLCPFRSFARHRLQARSLSLTDIGLSAAERGNLAHRALQYLWRRIGEHSKLSYMSVEELQRLVHSVVAETLKQHAAEQPETYTDRFTELEQRRLEQLLSQWLEVERSRSPFKVIATEEWQRIKFQELELRLRIDRLDELADGRCIVIDYKTGQSNIRDWESDNPNDPQLPLYAVTSEHEIAAVAFASLKPGKLKFFGQAEDADILPGVKVDGTQSWPQRLQDWKTVLKRLAQEFRAGKATVEPLTHACRYCDLSPLCRIYERAETLDAEAFTSITNDE